MKSFDLQHPRTLAQATAVLATAGPNGKAMAGGQDLLGELKDYLIAPDVVVNLKRIPGLDAIAVDSKGLRMGALVILSDVVDHPAIQQHYPAIAEAAHSVGSLQIRNVGTVGGNLCQRPRCWYYRNENVKCLKKGGDTCYSSADDGQNKYNAILGGGPSFIVHPSDLAPALVALGAVLTIVGPTGKRELPIAEFFTLPNQGSILQENVLKPGELVTEIFVPASPYAGRSVYLKFREKDSMDWALSSVAMAVHAPGGTVQSVHIVLGGVAPIPWRAKAAEAALIGHSLSDQAAISRAAALATDGANPLPKNGYKIPLTQTLVNRAAAALASGPRVAFSYDGGPTWTL